jgi:Mn-dependent DtxR family transcriptional regulator
MNTSAISKEKFDQEFRPVYAEEIINLFLADPERDWTRREISRTLDIETATVSGLIRPMIKNKTLTVVKTRNCSITNNEVEALRLTTSLVRK